MTVRNLFAEHLIFLVHFGYPGNDFVLYIAGGKNYQVLAERGEFSDKLIILNTIDGEEITSFKHRILLSQTFLFISSIMPLRLMNGLGGDIILGVLADPEEDGL